MSTPNDLQIESHTLLLPQRGFVLAHGGAGPQDPKGDRFLKAQEFLKQTLLQFPANGPTEAGRALSEKWPSLSFATQSGLWAVWAMEANPLFNAGLGASLQADGVARVSASFMESEKQHFSAVLNVGGLEHASELAWYLQNHRFRVLDQMGAQNLMRDLGLQERDLSTPRTVRRWLEHKQLSLASGNGPSAGRSGTVGSVTVDASHRLTAITSTGGVGHETPGRIGDSPTIAGNYCLSRVAISCTGTGEEITSYALAPRLALAVESGQTLAQAMRVVFENAKPQALFAAIAVVLHKDLKTIEWAAASCNCQLLFASQALD